MNLFFGEDVLPLDYPVLMGRYYVMVTSKNEVVTVMNEYPRGTVQDWLNKCPLVKEIRRCNTDLRIKYSIT